MALVLLLGLLVTAPPRDARAAFPGQSGRIAYTGASGNDFEIYSMTADGIDLVNLTDNASNRENDPAWSPNGTKIAYARADAHYDIWVMNADGSEPQNLTAGANDGKGNTGRHPTWSPDGAEIAYEDAGEIWTMAADGSDKLNLTSTSAASANGVESDPTYSPDGGSIAYVNGLDLWVMDSDGTNQRPLVELSAAERAPDWAPDGSAIVFNRGGEIWTVAPDGSGAEALVTSGDGGGTGPAYSPDGTRVVFSSSGFGALNGPDIITIGADGSDPQRVGGAPNATDFEANWQAVVDDADLNVSLNDTPDPASFGDDVTYVATIANESEADARLVALSSLLPTGATYVSVTSSQGTCVKKRATLTCKLGAISGGAAATVTVVVTPTSTFDLTYGVAVSSGQSDPDSSDNSATQTTAVLPPPGPDPQAFLTWSVPDRFKDYDNDNMRDENLFNNPKGAVVPFEMVLHGCDSTPFGSVSTYAFEVTLPSGQVLEQSSASCDFAFQPPKEGKYPVKLTITTADGGSATTQQDVPFRDLFIVSIGDSIASGEGNPDRICDKGCHFGEKPVWQHTPCHRSAISGPSRAAWNIEASDPTTSVTFTHLACSGAQVTAGILSPYKGIEPKDDELVPPQAKVLEALMKGWGRKPDAVLVSIGANDAKFADAVMTCLLPGRCQNDANFVAKVERLLRGLPDRYRLLDEKLDELGIPGKKVFITEYPDVTKNESGNYVECPAHLFASEWEWAAKNVAGPLNDHVRRAANKDAHGWNVVNVANEFRTHGYCSKYSWVVHIEQSIDWQGDISGAFHPNTPGHVTYGDHIAAVLRAKLEK